MRLAAATPKSSKLCAFRLTMTVRLGGWWEGIIFLTSLRRTHLTLAGLITINTRRGIFFYLIQNDPVGVDLWVSLGVEHDGLVGAEVRLINLLVLGAHVDDVRTAVSVKVDLALVTTAVVWENTQTFVKQLSFFKFWRTLHWWIYMVKFWTRPPLGPLFHAVWRPLPPGKSLH